MMLIIVARLCRHAAASVNKDVYLAVTSDKGLCGGVNSTITKYTKALRRMNMAGVSCSLALSIAGEIARHASAIHISS